MELKFITNDYILIWNLLYQPSGSKELNTLKHKLWNNYKEEYLETYNEKNSIFSDYKNYIPNNDLIYNLVLEREDYIEIKNNTEKYRKNLLKTWDQNKRRINEILRKTIRKNIIPYDIFLVSKDLDIIDYTIPNTETRGNIVIGKDDTNQLNLLLNIILNILKKELPASNEKEKLSKATIELLVLNEIPTKLLKKSTYFAGTDDLLSIKHKIYPYWLMYLGVKQEDVGRALDVLYNEILENNLKNHKDQLVNYTIKNILPENYDE